MDIGGKTNSSFSDSYTKTDLNYGWLDEPVDVDKDATLLNYYVEKVNTRDCSQNYTAGTLIIYYLN